MAGVESDRYLRVGESVGQCVWPVPELELLGLLPRLQRPPRASPHSEPGSPFSLAARPRQGGAPPPEEEKKQ